MPVPGLGSCGFNAAACVILHLSFYVTRESHNISVYVEEF